MYSRVDPDERPAQAWLNLGFSHFKLGQDGDAETAAIRAVALMPRLGTPRYLLALVLERTGRQHEAIEELRTALKVEPSHRAAFARLRALGAS